MRKAAAAAKAAPSIVLPDSLPTIYGLSVVGNCMAPAYTEGRAVQCSKIEPYQQDDVVVVWLRPDLVKEGRPNAMLKRIVMMPPPWVRTFPYRDHPDSEILSVIMLGMDSRPDEMFRVRCSGILAIHKVQRLLEPEEIAP